MVGDESYKPEVIWRALSTFATENRLNRITQVASQRSRQFIPILSDIYDRGNISAVLRSSEGLGFSEVHLIQRSDKFKAATRVTRGAEEWLDIFTWKDPSAILNLKKRGYKVLSTGFKDAISLEEVDFSFPTALVFGNEKDGVAEDISAHCDGCVYIPMQGFAQSFNISVAAAISAYTARRKIPVISNDETEFYRAKLLLRSLTNPEQLLGALHV